MSFSRPERGVSTPVVVAVLAVAVIAGTIFFLNSGGAREAKIEESGSGFVPSDPIALQRPSLEPVEDAFPRRTPESDEILKGDLIKYHDEFGNVRFRSREKIAGFNQLGETIYWQPDLRVGPPIKGGRMAKSSAIRSGAKPPKMVMRNGRAVMRPGATQPKVETGSEEGASGAGSSGGAGSDAPDLTGGGGG